MEWVETTGKTVDEAKDRALDQLGVAADDAEFEVLEEPRAGLFGRTRGEARVRARVRPTPVRPKVDRRRGGARRGGRNADESAPPTGGDAAPERSAPPRPPRPPRPARPPVTSAGTAGDGADGGADSHERDSEFAPPDVDAVRDAAVDFMRRLTEAFGFECTVEADVDGTEIEVRVDGENLGLLIGPGGRTLLAIQDLARVAAQRRLHDHETRLRVDVAGYREKRRVALERFATSVAEQVRSSGVARSLDAMPSADRKVIHDTLAEIDGVVSRSEGEDPDRRVVVAPG